MKRITPIAILLVCLTVVSSLAQVKKEEIDYEFPEAMPQDVRDGYLKEFKKGKVMFGINCGKCHNKTVKGKVIVPDFTPEQVANYEIRLANPKHQAELIEDKLLPEELVQITIYFTYKKKQASK